MGNRAPGGGRGARIGGLAPRQSPSFRDRRLPAGPFLSSHIRCAPSCRLEAGGPGGRRTTQNKSGGIQTGLYSTHRFRKEGSRRFNGAGAMRCERGKAAEVGDISSAEPFGGDAVSRRQPSPKSAFRGVVQEQHGTRTSPARHPREARLPNVAAGGKHSAGTRKVCVSNFYLPQQCGPARTVRVPSPPMRGQTKQSRRNACSVRWISVSYDTSHFGDRPCPTRPLISPARWP